MIFIDYAIPRRPRCASAPSLLLACFGITLQPYVCWVFHTWPVFIVTWLMLLRAFKSLLVSLPLRRSLLAGRSTPKHQILYVLPMEELFLQSHHAVSRTKDKSAPEKLRHLSPNTMVWRSTEPARECHSAVMSVRSRGAFCRTWKLDIQCFV